MKNWLYIEPYSLIFKTDSECLIYNTLDYKSTLLDINDDTKEIVESLVSDKCIVFTDEMSLKKNVIHFVEQVRKTYNGDVVSIDTNEAIRPAFFSPIINNQREFEKLDSYTWMNMNSQIMNYLEEIYVYINGIQATKDISPDLYKQIPCYIETTDCIDPQQLVAFFDGINDKQVNKINILGGDLFNCDKIENILEIVNEKASIINYYYRYDQWKPEYLKFIKDDNVKLTIIIPIELIKDIPVDPEIIKSISVEKKDAEFIFLIQSDDEIEVAEKIIKRYSLKNIQWKPVYNGNNILFFQENIYTDKIDFNEIKLSKRQIYSNQKINNNDFGRITILPDGKVYANLNFSPIGIISDRIQDLLYLELKNGNSWLRIRNQAPCADCVYRYLCPPPSNYELIIDKPNLCHVKQ